MASPYARILDALLAVPWQDWRVEMCMDDLARIIRYGPEGTDFFQPPREWAEFIASSPLWLAQMLCDVVEARRRAHIERRSWGKNATTLSLALRELGLDPEKYAELKRRLDAIASVGRTD